jgi:hypothetical protein
MDTGTLIVAIISIAIVSLPFALTIYNRKKKEKHLLRIVQSYAQKSGNRIKRFDVCGKRIIGLDQNSGILFFYNDETPQNTQAINLNDYHRSEVVVNELKVGSNGERTIVDTVLLKFIPKTGESKLEQLVLFDRKSTASLTEEILLAREWSKMINDRS